MAEGRSLRVLVVGAAWPPETFLQRLFDGLLLSGIDLTYAGPTRPGEGWLRRRGFSWLRTPPWDAPMPVRAARLLHLGIGGMLRGRSRLAAFAQQARGTGSVAQRARAWNRLLPFASGDWDVIYFPWNTAAVSHAGLYELGVPVVVSCRGSQLNIAPHDPDRPDLSRALAWSLEGAAAIHCVSEAMRHQAMMVGADRSRCTVIRPAVDPAAFQPGRQDHKAGRFTVVTTGNLIWSKGYEYALAGFRQLLDAGVDARLDIIGTGSEEQRIRFTVHDLDVADRVRLLGRLAPNAVAEHLQGADTFVLSSLSEGISNAVLEAMACGLPVVTTDCGGMREAVADGVEGFVIPSRDSRAIAARLVDLAADERLRTKMGQAARERVLREFTLDRQVAAFGHMLRGATARRGDTSASHTAATTVPEPA
jgi:colanic acid/amylovoran biosynthesis glycosyltransferase